MYSLTAVLKILEVLHTCVCVCVLGVVFVVDHSHLFLILGSEQRKIVAEAY